VFFLQSLREFARFRDILAKPLLPVRRLLSAASRRYSGLNAAFLDIDCFRNEYGGIEAMAGMFARRLIKLVLVAYWALLTVLLTAPHPEAAVGLREIPWFPLGDIGVHFCAFFVLAFLVCLTRWPAPIARRWMLILVVYAATTETLQAVIPFRSCELKDYCDNFLGIAAGIGLYWLTARLWREWSRHQTRTAPTCRVELTTADELSTRVPAELVLTGPRHERCVKK
jgi:VanZ family protein